MFRADVNFLRTDISAVHIGRGVLRGGKAVVRAFVEARPARPPRIRRLRNALEHWPEV